MEFNSSPIPDRSRDKGPVQKGGVLHQGEELRLHKQKISSIRAKPFLNIPFGTFQIKLLLL